MGPLWLVIPVHGRAGITGVCLEQKVHLLDELAALGIEAHVLVVGNDENLGTARELGFHTMERPNVLARKLNDAFEWACREGGAGHVSFVGSDDWLLPAFVADLPRPGQVRTSRWAAFVAPTGDRLVVLDMQGAAGNAPWVTPVDLLARSDYRPFQPETKRSGMDGMLRESLVPRAPHNRAERVRWYAERNGKERLIFDHREADPLRMVDFKGTREQMTGWSFVSGRRSRIRYDDADVWGKLATRYPLPLVERMQKLYAEGRA